MSGTVFPPGATIGVMGGGQLGRMLSLAAARMGYTVHVYSPDAGTPAGAVSARESVGGYGDRAAVEAFADGVDVVTFEFENVPAACVEWAAGRCAVRPGGNALHTSQNRLREKRFLVGAGLPLPRFAAAGSAEEFAAAVVEIGLPCVAKSAEFGYDGKGQRKLEPGEDPRAVWEAIGAAEVVVEEWVEFDCEMSAVLARGLRGEMAVFPVTRNEHRNHILHLSTVPFGDRRVEREVARIAEGVADSLGYVGVLAVEMFLCKDGRVLVNEIAPRTHNSGHWTIEGCETSQFEQQVRAVCGLPLGGVRQVAPAAMVNLLGEAWADGKPRWDRALEDPRVKLHLYGKAEPRPGRKMGHLTVLGDSPEDAARRAEAALARLRP